MIRRFLDFIEAGRAQLPQWTATFGLCLLLCVFPILLDDAYFNIMIVRTTFLGLVSVLFPLLCLGIDLWKNRSSALKSQQFCDSTTLSATLFLECFLLSCALSFAISDYQKCALTGEQARYMGLLTMVLMACAYSFISRYALLHSLVFKLFGVTVILCAGVALLQFVGFDPFGLYAQLSASTRRSFISFLGNINVFSSFICLAMPVFMHRYCTEKNGFDALIVCVACFLSIFLCNSDSAYIGLAVAFAAVTILSLRHSQDASKRMLWLWFAFFVTAKMFALLYYLGGVAVRDLSYMTKMVTMHPLGFVPPVILLGLALLADKRGFCEKARKKVLVAFCLTVGLLFVLVVFSVVWFTLVDRTRDLGPIGRFLRIDDNWGTGRAAIWRTLIHVYGDLPLKNKLFGVGSDCLGLLLYDKYKPEMYALNQGYINNAHNEFIQYLLTNGVFGMLCYTAFVTFGIAGVLCRKKVPAQAKSFALGALCYVAQSVVNITQPITTPLLFVFIAAARIGLRNERPMPNEDVYSPSCEQQG